MARRVTSGKRKAKTIARRARAQVNAGARAGRKTAASFRETAARAMARTTRQFSESLSERADMLQVMGKKVRPVPVTRLLDLLSEFLAVEKGGAQLYSTALRRTKRPEIRRALEIFLRQTERHATILTSVIRELGGNPAYMSASARVQEQRAQDFINLKAPDGVQEITDVESIVLAETKDHADWGFLSLVAPYIEDQSARELVNEAVQQVEGDEDEHVIWAKEALNRLMLESLTSRKRTTTRRKRAA